MSHILIFQVGKGSFTLLFLTVFQEGEIELVGVEHLAELD